MLTKIPNFFVLLSFLLVVLRAISVFVLAENTKTDKAKDWKKKDIRDYTDADVEKLYEQWEDGDDEPLEEDELPEWKRPGPKIDLSQINPDDPESMLKMTKTGRTLMMFATVSGNPTEKETETITQLWQSSLFNAHYEVQRYVVGSNRVLLMLNDGSKAWAVKDFLVKQDRCEVVTIEGKDYVGKGAATDRANAKSEKPSREDSASEKKAKKKAKEKREEL